MTAPILPQRSPFWIKWLRWYTRRFLRQNFHAVRLARGGRPVDPGEGPLIVVMNHPSWWDPLFGLILTELFPKRSFFVPIDALALAKYRVFAKVGAFGIELGTLAGSRKFLRTGHAICATPNTALWITAQGHFTDVRDRPIKLQTGVGHLLRRLDGGTVLPLALEYPFWDERYPEALARFGEPILIGQGPDRSLEEWMRLLENRLALTQDALATAARTRASAHFEILLGGKVGVGGFYDSWRRLKAWMRGERFDPAHGDEARAGEKV